VNEKKARPSSEGTPPASPPRKRFRLARLEERIAPKGHLNPKSKWVGGGGGSSNAASDTIY
jgi:hypothetical protein